MSKQDIDFMIDLLEKYCSNCNPIMFRSEVKGDDYDVSDGGIPLEMVIGEIEDDYASWQMLPSTITAEQVAELEKQVGLDLPPLFKAYLQAKFHLFDQIHNGKYLVLFPSIPSDYRLGNVSSQLLCWPQLLKIGYIPFAEYEDGYGPICFDTYNRGSDGDCPLVWIDHEELHALSEEDFSQREKVQPLEQKLHGSFREFVNDFFGC